MEKLFDGWQETIIWSCLQGIMGNIYADDEENSESAMAVLGDFCFLAGRPNRELLNCLDKERKQDFRILIPQSDCWAELIEKHYGTRARKMTRYAFKKEGAVFDRNMLEEAAESLPEGYSCRMIDRELFFMCREEEWSQDLVSQYSNYEDYEKLGIGAAVLRDGRVVAGASSYSRYREGIEIEIDTKAEYRRKGLAYACGARLILECLERKLYPSWDAQNLKSARLAKKLGYQFSHSYFAYEI